MGFSIWNLASCWSTIPGSTLLTRLRPVTWKILSKSNVPFSKICRSSLDGDPKKRQLLLEMIGYICSDLTVGKCAFFLQGQPNSGKSVIAEFISRLFDPSLVSNVPLHQLGERFSRAELAGKKVNIAGEIAGRALRDISIFKSVTGGDRITGEFKGKDLFYFIPRCKLLFAGNTLPRTTEADTTAAFANRLVSYSSIRASRRRNRIRACWIGFAKRRTPS